MAGIYLHIPFCKQACYYCDFHFSTSLKKKDELILALQKELLLRKNELEGEFVETIYFGGGTPSLLTNYEIDLLTDTIYKNYKVAKQIEVTLEANPDDLSHERIQSLASTRINRLSIGVQSFFDDDLKNMNRAHSSTEAKTSLEWATKYFNNITIDLIYGIPQMNLEKWHKNLEATFDYNIPHISSYALTVEPKTALDVFIKKGTYPQIDENLALEHFNHLVKTTTNNGFIQYEISNFGKEGYFSKHNSSYWMGKPYLGIGPSAHSFNGIQRSWNVSNNSKYIKSIYDNKLPQQVETLTKKDRFNEKVMVGLRTIWGLDLAEIENDFGEELKNSLMNDAKKFIDKQLLEVAGNVLKTSNKGKFLADGIVSELFMI